MAFKKTTTRRFCVATSGACALALATAALPIFDSTRELASGQTPTTDASKSDVVLPNATLPDAEALTTVPNSNFDPFNLSVGAKTNGAPVATGSNGANSNESELASLRAQMQALQSRLQKAPTSLEEQQEQSRIIGELAALQAQVQRLETSMGNFSAFRQARDLPNGGFPSSAMNGYNQRDAFDAKASAGISREAALGASGLDSSSLASRFGDAQLTEGEASLLREQKDGLTQQYRQIQQTLRALQPGDEALSANLRQELATILEQLKEIDSKLVDAPQTSAIPQIDGAPDQFSIPSANQLPNFMNATLPETGVAARMRKVEQAAQLLREAGLVQLANYAANESPRLADPNFVETSLTPGAWSESDGLAETRNNPFQQITPRDLEGITTSLDDLKTRVDALTETLTNVEAQLKLLTRVSGSAAEPITPKQEIQVPVEAPTQEEATKVEETTPETAAPSDNSPKDSSFSWNFDRYGFVDAK